MWVTVVENEFTLNTPPPIYESCPVGTGLMLTGTECFMGVVGLGVTVILSLERRTTVLKVENGK